MATHTLTIVIDDELWDELAVAARDHGEEPEQTVQRALAEYLCQADDSTEHTRCVH